MKASRALSVITAECADFLGYLMRLLLMRLHGASSQQSKRLLSRPYRDLNKVADDSKIARNICSGKWNAVAKTLAIRDRPQHASGPRSLWKVVTDVKRRESNLYHSRACGRLCVSRAKTPRPFPAIVILCNR